MCMYVFMYVFMYACMYIYTYTVWTQQEPLPVHFAVEELAGVQGAVIPALHAGPGDFAVAEVALEDAVGQLQLAVP